jgi:hypothetical protein
MSTSRSQPFERTKAGTLVAMLGDPRRFLQFVAGARRMTERAAHLVFAPTTLLERLAVLVPRPRVNLVLYHGVLAPRAA